MESWREGAVVRIQLSIVLICLAVTVCVGNAMAQGGAALPPPDAIPATPARSPKLAQAIEVFAAGDCAAACKSCEEAIVEQPSCEPEARTLMAQFYAAQGEFGKAKEQAALGIAKAEAVGSPVMADTKTRQQRISQWAADLDELLAVQEPVADAAKPDKQGAARLALAATLVRYGRLQQAAEVLAKIVADHPDTPEAIQAGHSLAALYMALGQPGKAKAMRPAKSVHGGDGSASCGIDESSLQDRIAAKLADTMKAKPGSDEAARAKYEMGWLYAAYEKTDDAIKHLTKIVKEQPYSPYAARAFGLLEVVYRQAGQEDDMKTALPPLVENTKSTALWWRLGHLYDAIGDTQKSVGRLPEGWREQTAPSPKGRWCTSSDSTCRSWSGTGCRFGRCSGCGRNGRAGAGGIGAHICGVH